MRIEDIRKYMLSRIPPQVEPLSFPEEYYDEDGYCGDRLLNKIRMFWEQFDSDDKFIYLISADWLENELDLDGGRSYLLNNDVLLDMIFDYLYNNLGYNKSKYKSLIYNGTTFTDNILDRYDDVSVVREENIKKIIEA